MAAGYHGVHERLVERLGEARGEAAYTFVACLLALGVSGLAAYLFAVLAGALSLAVFGLLDDGSVLAEGVTLARVGAAALSVALTGATQLLLRASHPPAGATVLIVSLGLLRKPPEMAALLAGVVLLTAAGWNINRLFGVPMPVWSARK